MTWGWQLHTRRLRCRLPTSCLSIPFCALTFWVQIAILPHQLDLASHPERFSSEGVYWPHCLKFPFATWILHGWRAIPLACWFFGVASETFSANPSSFGTGGNSSSLAFSTWTFLVLCHSKMDWSLVVVKLPCLAWRRASGSSTGLVFLP